MPEREQRTRRNFYESPLRVLRWTLTHAFPTRRDHILRDLSVNCLYYAGSIFGFASLNQSCLDTNSTSAIGGRLSYFRSASEDKFNDSRIQEEFRNYANNLSSERTGSLAKGIILFTTAAGIVYIARKVEKEG